VHVACYEHFVKIMQHAEVQHEFSNFWRKKNFGLAWLTETGTSLLRSSPSAKLSEQQRKRPVIPRSRQLPPRLPTPAKTLTMVFHFPHVSSCCCMCPRTAIDVLYSRSLPFATSRAQPLVPHPISLSDCNTSFYAHITPNIHIQLYGRQL
jgi:hypothetical protein